MSAPAAPARSLSADSDASAKHLKPKHRTHVPRRDSVALTDPAKDEAMTREEALALYHPIRASVRRILSAAIPVCNQSDFMRAAKQLGLWVEGKISLPEGDQAAEMLTSSSRTSAGGARSMSFLPPRHANSMLPISNWPNGWGRHSFLFSGAPRGTGSREFGSRTYSTETEAFGLWMKAWRRPPQQRALLACDFSTPANSMWGLGSSCRRMRRQPNSASRA